ncbi:MAG: hypothetical protein HOO06_14140 [Bdellovibrionaceae bacterium]|jgi:hypothetical protein|nr:hypothetical protein [Pseudobdellovibrionaceae bacterium]
MKNLLIAVSVLFAASAFAKVNKGSSWKQIKSDFSVIADAPQVAFAGNASTHYVSVLKVCQSGSNELRTASKVQLSKWVGSGEQEVLVDAGKAYLYTSKTYVKEYCTKKSCDWGEGEKVVQSYPSNYMISVLENSNNEKGNDEVAFSKGYSIRSCGK